MKAAPLIYIVIAFLMLLGVIYLAPKIWMWEMDLKPNIEMHQSKRYVHIDTSDLDRSHWEQIMLLSLFYLSPKFWIWEIEREILYKIQHFYPGN